ncbi:hypothetical protein ACH3VR_14040 [Microbacterium sp. B2969]|uniref:Uncharacterized protein n=1 Tax=Microbacterium alkaliflavum TaxID=3248839 RepID=A0ABW7QBH9_9MICO
MGMDYTVGLLVTAVGGVVLILSLPVLGAAAIRGSARAVVRIITLMAVVAVVVFLAALAVGSPLGVGTGR